MVKMCWVVVSMIMLACGADVTTTVEVEVGVGVNIAELFGHSPVNSVIS